MGFYIRGAATATAPRGQLLFHERMSPTHKGRGWGEPLSSKRFAPCLWVAIVAIAGSAPTLPGGVQICQLSSKQPIILPSTGMRVCLMPLLHFPFCAIELRQVADLGSHPYGLTGCEVGCLVVECHRFGSVDFLRIQDFGCPAHFVCRLVDWH